MKEGAREREREREPVVIFCTHTVQDLVKNLYLYLLLQTVRVIRVEGDDEISMQNRYS